MKRLGVSLIGAILSATPLLQAQITPMRMSTSELCTARWDSRTGIPYRQVAGANLGATSFALVDSQNVAFLCDASNEIVFADRTTGMVTKRFPVTEGPRDFVFDEGSFFVLSAGKVTVYDQAGRQTDEFTFPGDYSGTERLTRFAGSTYLLLPSGKSLKIESGRKEVTPQEYDGWVTATGRFVETRINGGNSYSVSVIAPGGGTFSKAFAAEKKVAGVFVVGATENRVVLDLQTFISESPIQVERKIVSVDLEGNTLGSIIAKIRVPDCYYVLSNKECDVTPAGEILSMVTSPEGVHIFSLSENKGAGSGGYPAALTTTRYHFNEHLIRIDEK